MLAKEYEVQRQNVSTAVAKAILTTPDRRILQIKNPVDNSWVDVPSVEEYVN